MEGACKPYGDTFSTLLHIFNRNLTPWKLSNKKLILKCVPGHHRSVGTFFLNQVFQSGDHPGPPTSPLQLTPVLVESQIQRIADTAGALVKSLPVSDLEPKQPNAKKKICKELEVSKLIISLGSRVVTCCEGGVKVCTSSNPSSIQTWTKFKFFKF